MKLPRFINLKNTLKSIINAAVLTTVTFTIFFIIELNNYKTIPDMNHLLTRMAYDTIPFQIMILIAVFPGNAIIIFLRFFHRIFGSVPSPVKKELETDEDLKKENEEYSKEERENYNRHSKYFKFNLSLAFTALILFCITIVFG